MLLTGEQRSVTLPRKWAVSRVVEAKEAKEAKKTHEPPVAGPNTVHHEGTTQDQPAHHSSSSPAPYRADEDTGDKRDKCLSRQEAAQILGWQMAGEQPHRISERNSGKQAQKSPASQGAQAQGQEGVGDIVQAVSNITAQLSRSTLAISLCPSSSLCLSTSESKSLRVHPKSGRAKLCTVTCGQVFHSEFLGALYTRACVPHVDYASQKTNTTHAYCMASCAEQLEEKVAAQDKCIQLLESRPSPKCTCVIQ